MTAQVIDISSRLPFVPAEPDGDDPNADLTPRTPREKRMTQLAFLEGFRTGQDADPDVCRDVATLVDVQEEIDRFHGRPLLKPVS